MISYIEIELTLGFFKKNTAFNFNLKPRSHCHELVPRVLASYNSPQLFNCRVELEHMSVDVEEMSLHVASTRQAAARILNGLKLSCEFWSRIDVEDMSNICCPVLCAYRRCVVTCRHFSPFRKFLDKLRSALRV